MFKPACTAFAALLGLNVAATAQTATTQGPACGRPPVADKVSLKPVPGSELMTVPVAINGKPKQFLLAIGTNPDEISEATVTELRLPQVDLRSASNAMAEQNSTFRFQTPVFDIMGTSTARNYQPRVSVASFTMGDATVHDLKFLVSGDRDMGKAKPYDGLLTAAGFRQYDMNIDFGGNELSFLAPTGCTDPNQIAAWPHTALAVIPMTTSFGKITVPVTIEGHQINAVIDTGSEHTVMRRAIAEQMFGLKADTPDMAQEGDLRDGTGARVYRHTFPRIAFEGIVASNVPALIQANSMVRPAHRAVVTGSRLQAAADPGEPVPDLALGMDVLHQLHIYAAFGQNTLYVTAAK